MQGNILGNIQYKCGFTHRWSGRYQNKIGRLHTRCLVIQIQKTCSNTRYIAMAVRSSLDLSHGVCNNLSDGHIVTGISSLYQIKNAFLRIFQNCLQFFFSCITGIGNLFVQLNQLAKSRLLCHNTGIIFNIRRSGYSCNQITDKLQTTDLRWHILFLQAILQGNQINRFSLVIQFHHGFKQYAILTAIEVLTCDDFRCHRNGIAAHNHGSDNRLLRFDAVG